MCPEGKEYLLTQARTKECGIALVLIVLGMVGMLAQFGCAAPGLYARMDDSQIRSVLAEKCPVGSLEAQVSASLDSLGAPKGTRLVYPATEARPRVLLLRLFADRGFWLSSDDADVAWLDISFVFSPEDKLQRTLLFRDSIRYGFGEPITSPNTPKRPLKGPLKHYPSPIPPPVDPLEGAS